MIFRTVRRLALLVPLLAACSSGGGVPNVVGRSTDAQSWTRVPVTVYSAASDGGADAGAGYIFGGPFPCVSAATSRLWVAYMPAATNGGSLYRTFTDNSSGTSHVDFAKLTLP